MKGYLLLAALLFSFLNSFPQNEKEVKNYLIVFFVSGFNGDSVRILLNRKTLMVVRLKSTPVLDQCSSNIVIKITDSVQVLTLVEVEKKKSFQIIIKKAFQYLYISRLSDRDLDLRV